MNTTELSTGPMKTGISDFTSRRIRLENEMRIEQVKRSAVQLQWTCALYDEKSRVRTQMTEAIEHSDHIVLLKAGKQDCCLEESSEYFGLPREKVLQLLSWRVFDSMRSIRKKNRSETPNTEREFIDEMSRVDVSGFKLKRNGVVFCRRDLKRAFYVHARCRVLRYRLETLTGAHSRAKEHYNRLCAAEKERTQTVREDAPDKGALEGKNRKKNGQRQCKSGRKYARLRKEGVLSLYEITTCLEEANVLPAYFHIVILAPLYEEVLKFNMTAAVIFTCFELLANTASDRGVMKWFSLIHIFMHLLWPNDYKSRVAFHMTWNAVMVMFHFLGLCFYPSELSLFSALKNKWNDWWVLVPSQEEVKEMLIIPEFCHKAYSIRQITDFDVRKGYYENSDSQVQTYYRQCYPDDLIHVSTCSAMDNLTAVFRNFHVDLGPQTLDLMVSAATIGSNIGLIWRLNKLAQEAVIVTPSGENEKHEVIFTDSSCYVRSARNCLIASTTMLLMNLVSKYGCPSVDIDNFVSRYIGKEDEIKTESAWYDYIIEATDGTLLYGGEMLSQFKHLLANLIGTAIFPEWVSVSYTKHVMKVPSIPTVDLPMLILGTVNYLAQVVKAFHASSSWREMSVMFHGGTAQAMFAEVKQLKCDFERVYVGAPGGGLDIPLCEFTRRINQTKTRMEFLTVNGGGVWKYLPKQKKNDDTLKVEVKALFNEVYVKYLALVSGNRAVPIGFNLVSRPGVGKTVLTEIICHRVCKIFNIPYDANLIYCRDPNFDFWDGYRNQPVVVFPEIGAQNKEIAKTQGDPIAQSFMQFIDGKKMPLNMADLPDKGKYFMNSPVGIIDSNNLTGNFEVTLFTPEAAMRRFHYFFIEVKPEYAKKIGDTQTVTLDPKKAMGELDIYNFTYVKWAPGTSNGKVIIETQKKFKSIHQYMAFIDELIIDHFETEKKCMAVKDANLMRLSKELEEREISIPESIVPSGNEWHVSTLAKYHKDSPPQDEATEEQQKLWEKERQTALAKKELEKAAMEDLNSVVDHRPAMADKVKRLLREVEQLSDSDLDVLTALIRRQPVPESGVFSKAKIAYKILTGEPQGVALMLVEFLKANVAQGNISQEEIVKEIYSIPKTTLRERIQKMDVAYTCEVLLGLIGVGAALFIGYYMMSSEKANPEATRYRMVENMLQHDDVSNNVLANLKIAKPKARDAVIETKWTPDPMPDTVKGGVGSREELEACIASNLWQISPMDYEGKKSGKSYPILFVDGFVAMLNVHTVNECLATVREAGCYKDDYCIPVIVSNERNKAGYKTDILIKPGTIVPIADDVALFSVGAESKRNIRKCFLSEPSYTRYSYRSVGNETFLFQKTTMTPFYPELEKELAHLTPNKERHLLVSSRLAESEMDFCGHVYYGEREGRWFIHSIHSFGSNKKAFSQQVTLTPDDFSKMSLESRGISLNDLKVEPVDYVGVHDFDYCKPGMYSVEPVCGVGAPSYPSRTNMRFNKDIDSSLKSLLEIADEYPFDFARLNKYKQCGVVHNPYKKHFEKFEIRNRGYISKHIPEVVTKGWMKRVASQLLERGEVPPTFYGLDQAVNGECGNQAFARLNGATSGGYGFSGKKRDYLKPVSISEVEAIRRHILPEDQVLAPGFYQQLEPEVATEVYYNLLCWRNGKCHHAPKNCVPKDEPRPVQQIDYDTLVAEFVEDNKPNEVMYLETSDTETIFIVVDENKEILKTQRIPKCGVKRTKTVRLFNPDSMDGAISSRMVLSPLYDLMKRHPDLFLNALCINHKSDDWKKLEKHLKWKDRCRAGDVKDFDSSHPSWIDHMAAVALYWLAVEMGCDREYCEMVYYATMEDTVSYVIINGVMFRFYNVLPSGLNGTTEKNCLKNAIGHMVAWCLLCTPLGKKYAVNKTNKFSFEDFFEHTCLRVLGDDNIDSDSEAVAEYYNMITICEAYAAFGVTYTDSDKKTPAVPFQHISEIDFLKRSFREKDELGIVAPLDKTSLYKMLAFTMKPRGHDKTFSEVFKESASMFLEEWCLHKPKSEWEQGRSKIIEMVSDVTGVPIEELETQYMSYDKYLETRHHYKPAQTEP